MSEINTDKLKIYSSKIKIYHNKVIKNKDLSFDDVRESRIIIGEYYQYLKNSGIPYGKAALSVLNDEFGFGSFANLHLLTRAKHEGRTEEQIIKTQDILPIRLAYSDIDMRLKSGASSGEEYSKIAKYHYDAYKAEHLSRYAWGGALFQEHVGSGAWMKFVDKTAKYQHSGSFVGAILNNHEKNEVNAREALKSLYETESIERGMEYSRQDEVNVGTMTTGQKYYIGDEEIGFFDTFFKTSASLTIGAFIGML